MTGAIAFWASLWWVVTEGAPSSWIVGVPAVVLASYLSLALTGWRSMRVRPHALVALGALFVLQSIRGGVDVARRVLGPTIAVEPAVISYDWRLPRGGLRILAVAIMTLQPGTLGVWSDARRVHVHVLDRSVALDEQLGRLEDRLAGLLGLRLPRSPEIGA